MKLDFTDPRASQSAGHSVPALIFAMFMFLCAIATVYFGTIAVPL